MQNNRYFNGGIILICATMISKFIGAIYRIPLSNIIGAEGIGMYQLAFPVYNFLLLLVVGGIPVCLSKMIAELRAEKKQGVKNLFLCSFLFCLIFGFILSIFLYFSAGLISKLQGNTEIIMLYKAISFAILFASLSTCIKSLFQGYQNMMPTALANIFEQLVKLIFGLLLAKIFLSKGLDYAVFGAVLGVLIAEILSFICLSIYLLFNKNKYLYRDKPKYNISKPLFKNSFPILLGTIIAPFFSVIESFIVINALSNYMSKISATTLFGIQSGMIMPLINMPLIICSSLSIALLPNLCFAIKTKNNDDINAIITNTLKFVWCFVIACCAGYIVIAKNLLLTVYPLLLQNIEVAIILLIFSSLGMIFLSVAQSITTMLQANNKMYLPTLNFAVVSIIKILMVLILIYIPKVNILALAISYFISYVLYAVINLYALNVNFKIKWHIDKVFFEILSAVIMALAISFLSSILSILPTLINLVICILVGVIIYVTLLLLFKDFNLKNITQMLKCVLTKFKN